MPRGKYVTTQSRSAGKLVKTLVDNKISPDSDPSTVHNAPPVALKKEPVTTAADVKESVSRNSGKKKKIPIKKSTAPASKARKARRWRSGTVALREIRKFQNTIDPLIPIVAMRRLIRDALVEQGTAYGVGMDGGVTGFKITKSAVKALIHESSAFLSELLGEAGVEAIKAGRVTLHPKDLREAVRLHVTHETMGRRRRHVFPDSVEADKIPTRQDGRTVATDDMRVTSLVDAEVDSEYVPDEEVAKSDSESESECADVKTDNVAS